MKTNELSPLARPARTIGLIGLSTLSLMFARRADAATSVKCIGEQTTQTTEMTPTWPVQMQMDLGNAYTVTDDGDGNGTVLAGNKGGTHTFATATNAPYKDSIMSPDIVVIGPWAEHDEIAVKGGADATHFQMDYDALVMDYLNLPKKPCVIVTTPVVISTYQQNPATDMLVTDTIEPAVLAVAKAHQLPVVDLYTAFMNQAAWLGADGHFSAAGAKQVAKMVEAALPMCAGGGTPGSDAGSGAGGDASSGAGGSGGGGVGSGGSGMQTGSGGSGGNSEMMSGTSGSNGSSGSEVTGNPPSTTGEGGSAMTNGTGSTTCRPPSCPPAQDPGCSFSGRSAPPLSGAALAGLLALLGLRRRR
jgi:MYXO-CTERM domain-containing protein